MKKLAVALIALGMIFNSTLSQAWEPDTDNKLELSVQQAIIKAKDKDPSMAKWFNAAYAYAVFPRWAKAVSASVAHMVKAW